MQMKWFEESAAQIVPSTAARWTIQGVNNLLARRLDGIFRSSAFQYAFLQLPKDVYVYVCVFEINTK